MAVKVWDRDEFRKMAHARRIEENKQYVAGMKQRRKASDRAQSRQDRGNFFKDLWRAFGLYNHDPYIQRISMVQEAERQIGIQRDLQAQRAAEERQFEIAQRRADQADEERRMKIMAREMAKEMFAEAERLRNAR